MGFLSQSLSAPLIAPYKKVKERVGDGGQCPPYKKVKERVGDGGH